MSSSLLIAALFFINHQNCLAIGVVLCNEIKEYREFSEIRYFSLDVLYSLNSLKSLISLNYLNIKNYMKCLVAKQTQLMRSICATRYTR